MSHSQQRLSVPFLRPGLDLLRCAHHAEETHHGFGSSLQQERHGEGMGCRTSASADGVQSGSRLFYLVW